MQQTYILKGGGFVNNKLNHKLLELLFNNELDPWLPLPDQLLNRMDFMSYSCFAMVFLCKFLK